MIATLPGAVERALRELGTNLRIARKRRNETLATFAARMQVSVPTLRKMELGDPAVSIAVYAMAMWLIDRLTWLPEIADPAADEVALGIEIARIKKPGSGTRAVWRKP